MIADEHSLIKEVDVLVMAKLYEYQAMALDRDVMDVYRDHYRRRLVAIRNEIDNMLEEIDRGES